MCSDCTLHSTTYVVLSRQLYLTAWTLLSNIARPLVTHGLGRVITHADHILLGISSEVVVRHYDSVLLVEACIRSERLLLIIFRLIAGTLKHYIYIDPATHHLRYFASYSARAMSTDWTF
jgi:hypothetical protein